MAAESSAEGLAGADALGVEPAAESLEESSDEQAVSVSGSIAAADTATAARRKRSVFMAFSWIEGDVRSGGWWRGWAGRAGAAGGRAVARASRYAPSGTAGAEVPRPSAHRSGLFSHQGFGAGPAADWSRALIHSFGAESEIDQSARPPATNGG
ncbi:hypothetical protein GCM10010504_51810 [Streptomyces griseus]|nr:hypothetical protein GCM10010504_51810 [Streptomyces griseus]